MGLSKEKSYVITLRVSPETGKILRLWSILSGKPMAQKIGQLADELAQKIDFQEEFGLPESVVENYLKNKFQQGEEED